VLNLRLSSLGTAAASPIMTHTSMNLRPTSIPAQRSITAGIIFFLLAVFARKVYRFTLLSELTLNSGFDTFRRVWFITGRNRFLAITLIDLFPRRVPLSLLPALPSSPFSSFRVAALAGHAWFIGVHRQP
jgi:hypothetical protein